MQGESARTAVREWLARNPIPFEAMEDPKRSSGPVTLIERLSGKGLTLASWESIREVERDQHAGTQSTYFRVELDDGRRFALSALGFVFTPSFDATGPVPDCPPAASFLDFAKLFRHLEHLSAEDHAEHAREAFQVLMVLLAFLEGARAIGLEVEEEERALDAVLQKLEAKKKRG